jgi:hypothetical protein
MKKAALAKPCYASQHLTPGKWGILEVCLRLTRGGKNRLFLDGRSLANRFDQTGKNAVYRIVKQLERKGWLVRVDGGMRNQQTGKYDSTKYRFLSHPDWTKLDGNTCPGSERPCPIDAKNPSPVPNSGLDLSRNVKPPVPEPGHNSDRTLRLEPSENKEQWSADADLLFPDFPLNWNSSLPTDSNSSGASLVSKPKAEPKSSRKVRPPHQDFILLRSAVWVTVSTFMRNGLPSRLPARSPKVGFWREKTRSDCWTYLKLWRSTKRKPLHPTFSTRCGRTWKPTDRRMMTDRLAQLMQCLRHYRSCNGHEESKNAPKI